MKQFISPQILRIDNQPSPCECHDNIICAYCVQANLLLWERQKSPKFDPGRAIKKIREHGIRRFSREFGISLKTLNNWNKKGFIPQSKLEEVELFFRE